MNGLLEEAARETLRAYVRQKVKRSRSEDPVEDHSSSHRARTAPHRPLARGRLPRSAPMPSYRWTVDELAKRVAMSRAAFARRFTSLVGEAPHAYVTRWRMNLAARLLRTTSSSAEQIAAQVGYESPTAFSVVFRRHLAVSPGKYRRLPLAFANHERDENVSKRGR